VVLTMPLLEGTDGVRKMSKSLGNYIALEDAPEDMFGKVMSISDALMHRYYELLTTADLHQVKSQHPMEAKLRLAKEIVSRYHGAEAASRAETAFQQRFRAREFPAEPDARVVLTRTDLTDSGRPAISLVDLLLQTNLVPSKSEARRLIVQGGLEIDDQKHTDPNESLGLSAGQQYRVRVGRRKTAIVEFKPS
jgi:tyrosyl-tRNA synthetase